MRAFFVVSCVFPWATLANNSPDTTASVPNTVITGQCGPTTVTDTLLYGPILDSSHALAKREQIEDLDAFSSAALILKTRLEYTHTSVKALLVGDRWKNIGASHVPHVTRYFEQLVYERWSKLLPESDAESLDQLIDDIFEDLQPMRRAKTAHFSRMSEEVNAVVAEFEKNLFGYRLVVLRYLYKKNQHYRENEMHSLKAQLAANVARYRGLGLAETARTRKIDMLINAAFELVDWATQEYSSRKDRCYTSVQGALASRLKERLHSLNQTLSIITETDPQNYARLVSTAHDFAFEFFGLSFPSNGYTRDIVGGFQDVFERLARFDSTAPGTPSLIPLVRIRAWAMRTKLATVSTHLARFRPATSLPPEAYWKLLQVKVDVRNWMAEVSGWESTGDEAQEVHSLKVLCNDTIKEVNRLKRTMDRIPIGPEVDPI